METLKTVELFHGGSTFAIIFKVLLMQQFEKVKM